MCWIAVCLFACLFVRMFLLCVCVFVCLAACVCVCVCRVLVRAYVFVCARGVKRANKNGARSSRAESACNAMIDSSNSAQFCLGFIAKVDRGVVAAPGEIKILQGIIPAPQTELRADTWKHQTKMRGVNSALLASHCKGGRGGGHFPMSFVCTHSSFIRVSLRTVCDEVRIHT